LPRDAEFFALLFEGCDPDVLQAMLTADGWRPARVFSYAHQAAE